MGAGPSSRPDIDTRPVVWYHGSMTDDQADQSTGDTQPFTVRLPVEEHAALRHLSGATGMSMQGLVAGMIHYDLGEWYRTYREDPPEILDGVRAAHRTAYVAVCATIPVLNSIPGPDPDPDLH